MAMFKTLSDLKRMIPASGDGGGGSDKYFKVDDGESFQIRFRQELTADASGYTDEADAAKLVRVHSNPADFTKSAVCTSDSEESGYKCWACEQIPKDKKWSPKLHLLVNIAVYNPDSDTWEPKVLDQKFTSAHTADSIVEYANEYGTLLDRTYKISRKGKKQATQYNLIPLAVKDADESITSMAYFDLSKHHRNFRYSEQAGYYLSQEDKGSSGDWE
jgi:hypothetical protein